MPFSIVCNNKGCGQQQEPFLDPTTNKVYCAICGQEISNVNQFTKTQMKFIKQFRPKTTESFSVKCEFCNETNRPNLVNDVLTCARCKKVLTHISPMFVRALKEYLKSAG
jgi:hypothetical protein